jgi:predicted hotdog family 3-hydroxylacyl-ACP dehydratase
MHHPDNTPIEAYVPHRGEMLLLDRMIEVDARHAVAEAVIRPDGLFVRDGRMPGWVGIEYMAQTISAWSGGRGIREGSAPRIGFLLGSRRYQAHCADFAVGSRLRIEARQEFISDNGLAMFDCRILLADLEAASARISVFEPEDGLAALNSNHFQHP